MSVIDFGGTNQHAGDGFTESGTKPIPAEGWGTFVIINSKTINGNLIYTAQNSRKEECGIFLGFAGQEQWQKDQARNTLGKMMQVCGVQGAGPGGNFTMPDIVKFHGMQLDIKIKHRESKKDGKTYINANGVNYAKAGTEAGAGTGGGTSQQPTSEQPPQKQGASAFGA